MRGILFLLLTMGLSLSVPSSVVAQQATESTPQNSDVNPEKAEIEKLVQQLGSELFAEREAAAEKLRKHAAGKSAVAAMTQAALQKATTDTDREVVFRAKELLAELKKQHENRGVVCVVGLYESRERPAVVEITDTTRPIILVVCAYDRVTWQIKAAKGVDLVRVIASGYHAQRVEGTDVPVTNFSYDEGRVAPDGKTSFFYAYDYNEENYPNMVASVQALTGGKKPKWFQGRYGFKQVPFVIEAPE
jgi:hypothetical protein